jgi:DNA-binding transcriptional LysR family regulator
LTIPQRLASTLERSLGLVVMPVPLDLQGYTLAQMWHDRTHADPAHAWLRRTIAEVCESL